MTRPTVVGVSLKSYFGYAETLTWVRSVAAVAAGCDAIDDGSVELFVLPSSPTLVDVIATLSGSRIGVGAQDVSAEEAGARTGEVSAQMLAEIGCSYAEVGHAERRRWQGETGEVVAAKVAAALRHGLTPVLCVGEVVATTAAEAASACVAELLANLASSRGLDGGRRVVVAYEPQWAIGAERPAPPEHIAYVCRALREVLARHDPSGASIVVYGGSAGPGLLEELGDSVSGLFLGRFAHDPRNVSAVLSEASRRST